ncbi:MAG: PxxKW family cysteine-rich protein [Thermodesulfobacteriota bacterium]
MICETTRKGMECAFMSKNGCTFNGGTCYEIVEPCNGCNRAAQFETGWFCTAAPDPSVKWKNGKCNLATHVKEEAAQTKGKVNPIKASKRGGGR